jgi:hypothetical protein
MSTPSRKPATIELHIEELVLHGFAPGDRYRIGEAVQRELVRLLSEQGVPLSLGQDGEIARLDGGTFKVTSSKPETVGTQVAQAVHGSLQQ